MRFLETVAGCAIAAACLLVLLQVVLPYFPSLSMPWIPEVERYFVIYGVYIAAGAVFARGGHIAVEFAVDRLPKPWRLRVEVFGVLLGLAFAITVGLLGIKWVEGERMIGSITTSGISLPLWTVQISIPLGLLILALFMVRRLIRLARGEAADGQKLVALLDKVPSE